MGSRLNDYGKWGEWQSEGHSLTQAMGGRGSFLRVVTGCAQAKREVGVTEAMSFYGSVSDYH